jgi:hypothetical protein
MSGYKLQLIARLSKNISSESLNQVVLLDDSDVLNFAARFMFGGNQRGHIHPNISLRQ